MARYNLCRVSPKGFLHSQGFLEVRDSLAWSLSSLGHETMLTDNSFSAGQSTNIIFGAELLPPTTVLPPNSIIYNMEQPTHPNLENVRRIVAESDCSVWDYNLRNLPDWHARGIPALHLPIGYTPNLTRIPKPAAQPIDVLFYGWFTPRRSQLIQALRAAGLNVVATDSCYGGGRDELISRSKVVLNVNHDGRSLFNIVRVSFLLANSKCVVSEVADDDTDYLYIKGGMWRSTYPKIVDDCLFLAKNEDERIAIENAAAGFRHEDFTASVARVLDQPASANNNNKEVEGVRYLGGVNGTAAAIRSRYDRGLREGDMVDFLPWLRSHARGQILEIGTRDGASTSAFLLGLEDNDPAGRLTSLDIDDCSHLWRHPQWTFIRSNSLTVRFPDASFDLALIDGNHERAAYIGDLYNCYHWVRPGGLILTHDLVPERGHEFYAVGIREEWDKFLRSHPDLKHYILPGRHGLGVMEKPR